MITNDLDELQRLPEECSAEDRTPCIPAADQRPTFTTVC